MLTLARSGSGVERNSPPPLILVTKGGGSLPADDATTAVEGDEALAPRGEGLGPPPDELRLLCRATIPELLLFRAPPLLPWPPVPPGEAFILFCFEKEDAVE